MPDPVETLRILVEASVAIAGFSGVVVVFGRRATEEWSELERSRIRNLLITSFTVLFLSLVALLLLHSGIDSETTWRVGSAAWSVSATYNLILVLRGHRSARGDPQRSSTTSVALVIGTTIIVVGLNLANALVLGRFWPFLTALIWLFAASCYTFARLLLLRRQGGQAAFQQGAADDRLGVAVACRGSLQRNRRSGIRQQRAACS